MNGTIHRVQEIGGERTECCLCRVRAQDDERVNVIWEYTQGWSASSEGQVDATFGVSPIVVTYPNHSTAAGESGTDSAQLG